MACKFYRWGCATLIWFIALAMGQALPVLAGNQPVAQLSPIHWDFLSVARRTILGQQINQVVIWPGFRLETIPFIFYQPGRIAFLFNYRGALPHGYRWLGGDDGGVAVTMDTRGLEAGISISHSVGDQQAVAVATPFADHGHVGEVLLLAVHEGFHYYQSRLPKHRFSYQELELASARDIALAEVEQKWLAEALQAKQPEHVKSALRSFAAVRDERRKVQDDRTATNEDGLEAHEGSAQYVERQFAALTGLRPMMPEGVANSLGGDIANLVTLLQRDLEPRFCRRARYYWTGAAMGYCLDALGVEWKQALDNGVDLLTQIKRASGYALSDQARILADALQGADLTAAEARLHDRLAHAETSAQTALSAFQRSAGLRVEVLIPDSLPLGVTDEGPQMLSASDTLYTDKAVVSVSADGLALVARGASLLEHQASHRRFRLTIFLPVDHPAVLIGGRALMAGTQTGSIDLRAANLTLRSPKVSASRQQGGLVLDLSQGR